MNARFRKRYPDETRIMGQFVFDQPDHRRYAKSNRGLLTAFCHTNDLFITNTSFSHTDDELMTYYELAAKPMQVITPNSFAQIDFIMCPLEWQIEISDVRSFRKIGFASHHFLLRCGFGKPIQLGKQQMQQAKTYNWITVHWVTL